MSRNILIYFTDDEVDFLKHYIDQYTNSYLRRPQLNDGEYLDINIAMSISKKLYEVLE